MVTRVPPASARVAITLPPLSACMPAGMVTWASRCSDSFWVTSPLSLTGCSSHAPWRKTAGSGYQEYRHHTPSWCESRPWKPPCSETVSR